MLNEFVISNQTKSACKNKIQHLIDWINQLNDEIQVEITQNNLSDSTFWYYDTDQGVIRNKNNSFFQIAGLETCTGETTKSQPIIIQDEIGYLGILCKEFDGVLHFLMQAKIEPGNINKIQISPTIQATKSNFMQKHGGAKPKYLEFFQEKEKYEVIVDQIQSEQSSRFYKKRNRNIILKVSSEVEELQNFKWMTLGQIKALLKHDNLVNMDTRTVLSCIPYSLWPDSPDLKGMFCDESMYHSIYNYDNKIPEVFSEMNDIKMFSERKKRFVPLECMTDWTMTDFEIRGKKKEPFSVIFCDIQIEGREVSRWTQPLFKAEGIATFGLFTAIKDGKRLFLVKMTAEVGCHDLVEIGPTIQTEATEALTQDTVSNHFFECYREQTNVITDVLLSEEGGRFYHEQNRNIVIETEYFEDLPDGYLWTDYKTLNILTQVNNCLNIQLRNLLSLLEF